MSPRDLGYSMPAEWQPHRRCWMAWPCHLESWQKIGLERAKQAYALVAKTIAIFEPVRLLVRPEDRAEAEALCGPDIEYQDLALNDSWTRDTGPSFLIQAETGKLAGVDWIHNAWGGNYSDYALDQQIAKAILHFSQAAYFHAPLVMEGGAFHVDGQGTLLTTKECLLNKNRNPELSQAAIEQFLQQYLNVQTILWLNRGLIGDETDGHVDEIACFIAPGKVLCLRSDDTKDENYALLEENYQILCQSRDARGRALEVHSLLQPKAQYLDGQRLTLSYINFYRANQGIVMPAFGDAHYDQLAYVRMQQLFPDCQIRQIAALDVFAGGGGIHCITQQEPL